MASICKGVTAEIKRLCKIMDYPLSDTIIECIGEENEKFILEIIEEASTICTNDKRKIINFSDVDEAIKMRDMELFDHLLNKPDKP